MTSVDDDVLWRRAQRGDRDAFGELFDRRSQVVLRYCFHRTADVGRAEDMTSITFLEAWRRRDLALQPGKVVPFLLGVASNVVRTERRSMRRYHAALNRLPRQVEESDFVDALADKLDAEQRMRAISARLRSLPAGEQEVLALCVWEGLSQADAAFALGIPEATVRSRLFRVRARLNKPEDAPTRQLLKGTGQ